MSNVKKQYELITDDQGLYGVSRAAHEIVDSANNYAANPDGFDSRARSNAEVTVNILMKRCRTMVEQARARVMSEAREAHDKGYTKGYDNGYKEAYNRTFSQALAEKHELTEAFNKLAVSYKEASLKDTDETDKNKSLDKALELAKEIINTELANNPEAFYSLYKKAAQHISNVRRATVKTSQKGAQLIETDRRRYENAIEGLEELTVEADGDEAGRCILETELGTIDASVSAQFERAKHIMIPQG